MKRSIRLIALFLAVWMGIQPMAVCAQEPLEEPTGETLVQQVEDLLPSTDEQEIPEKQEIPEEEEQPVPEPEEEIPESEEDEEISKPEKEETPELEETEVSEGSAIPEDADILEEQEELPEEVELTEETESFGEISLDDMDWYASDELLWAYFYKLSGFGAGASTMSIDNINQMGLTDRDKLLCTLLADEIKRVAEYGGSSKLTVQYTFDSKQNNVDLIIRALLYLMPYELYWFDKTKSSQYSWSGNSFTLYMNVASAYADTTKPKNDPDYPYYVTTNVSKIRQAAANANNIVARYAALTDYEKLDKYREEICNLTSYNDAAVSKNYTGGYGDPWQLIYVFDNDATTKVVCEGYSKAFQHLCDLSFFSDVECRTVTGIMTAPNVSGPHMWNIVTIGGRNYLVDITNCDFGTAGYPKKLFLCGATGNARQGYEISSLGMTYTYDNGNAADIGSMMDLFGEEALTLSDKTYSANLGPCDYEGHKFESIDYAAATCEEEGHQAGKVCSVCGEIGYGMQPIAALGHISKSLREQPATCEEDGLTAGRQCFRTSCGKVLEGREVIPALGHEAVEDEAVEPSCTATGLTAGAHCSRCGKELIHQETVKAWGHILEFVDGEEPREDAAGMIPHNRCIQCGMLFDELGKNPVQNVRCIKITYELNGAEDAAGNPSEYVPANEPFELKNPVKTGYKFRGWYQGNTKYDYLTETLARNNESLTLTAQWTPIKYTLHFDTNGGTGRMSDITSVAYDTDRTVACAFNWTGYSFVGWHTSRSCDGEPAYPVGTPIRNAAESARTVTLYAIWRPSTYTVRFDGNGADGEMEPMSVQYGEAVSLNTNSFTRNTFRFNGWNTLANGKGKAYADGVSVQNLTAQDGAEVILYAQWIRDFPSYTVRFDANTGIGTMNAMANLLTGKGYTLSASTFKKTGYTQIGWSYTADGDKEIANRASFSDITLTTLEEMGAEDYRDRQPEVTLYAVWAPINYTLVYNGNGGVTDSRAKTVSVPMRFDDSAVLEDGEIFSRVGYTFVGWNTKSSAAGTAYEAGRTVQNLSATANAKVYLYAIWQPNNYTIQFDGNGNDGGAVPGVVSTKYNVAVKLPANTALKFGHRFVGWRDANGKLYKDKVSVKNLTAEVDGNVTLKAEWALNTYSVAFHFNGGTAPDKVPFAKRTGLTALDETGLVIPAAEPTRDGYKFAGWNTRADGQGEPFEAGDEYMPNARTNNAVFTLYARWEYTMALDGNGTGFTEEQTHSWNEVFPVPGAAGEKTGYALAGWNTSLTSANAGTVKYKVGSTMKNPGPGGTTLYAVWKPITYQIHFDANGGTGRMSDRVLTYNKAAVLTANAFRKAGKVFMGWALDSGASEPNYINKETVQNLSTVPGEVITLYAVWGQY